MNSQIGHLVQSADLEPGMVVQCVVLEGTADQPGDGGSVTVVLTQPWMFGDKVTVKLPNGRWAYFL